MHATFRRLAVCLALVLVSSCGGGGGSSSSPHGVPTAQATTPATAGRANASITISLHPITTTSSNTRRPRFVDPTTESVVYTLASVNGAPPSGATSAEQDLVPGASGCTSNAGTLTCTTQLNLPVGTITLNVKTYAQTGGAGAVLGTGTATATIIQNAANNITLTIGGVIAQVQLNVTPATLTPTVPSVTPLQVTALDANGNEIISPGDYDKPIVISISGGGGHIAFSLNGGAAAPTATLASPSDTVTVNYDGTPVTGSATIQASVAETTPVSASFALSVGGVPVTGTASGPYQQNAGFVFTALNQSSTFTVAGGTPPYSFVAPQGSVATVTLSGTSGTVQSTGFGSTVVQISDSAGAHFSIPITVNSPAITISYTACGGQATCTPSETQFNVPPISSADSVTLNLSGGTGTFAYAFASTGLTTSSCDTVTGSGSTLTFTATGACTDLVEITSGNQVAYYTLVQKTGSPSYTVGSAQHAYFQSPNNLEIVAGGHMTLALSDNGPWTENDTCSSLGGSVTFDGNTATIAAATTVTPSTPCSVTLTSASGTAITPPISVQFLNPLSVSTQSVALHNLSDASSVTVLNFSTTAALTSSVDNTNVTASSASASVTITAAAYGTSLVTIKDTNLDEKIGVAVTVDNGYTSVLPSAIGYLSSVLPNSSSNAYTATFYNTVGNYPVASAVSLGPPAIGTVTLFSAGTGALTITPNSYGTGSLQVTDFAGINTNIPVTSFNIQFQTYSGALVSGSTANEVFTSVYSAANPVTDTVAVMGPTGTFTVSSSNPSVVSVPGTAQTGSFVATPLNTGTSVITITDTTNHASVTYTASVSSLTVPVLGKVRRTH